MSEPSVVHNTFVIERRYRVPSERVFAALSDPAQVRRWYAGAGGRTSGTFEMDFKPNGRQRLAAPMGEETPFPGVMLTSEATYLDIVPGRRVIVGQTMTLGERRLSLALITYEILATDEGSDLIFTHQGVFFEGADGPRMREDGWRILLESLGAELAR
jgi:uncharacterized protein YndB with AHSA1/START domain